MWGKCAASSVYQVGALAVREACIFCLKSGVSSVVIKNDNSAIISWCSKKYLVPPWDCSMIMCDILEFVLVANLYFASICRNANRGADWLGCHCRKIGALSFDSNFPPLELIEFL